MKKIFNGAGLKDLLKRVSGKQVEHSELQIFLPPTSKDSGQVILDHQQLYRYLMSLDSGSLPFLQATNLYMEHLNHVELAPERRYKLIALIMKEVSPVIALIYRTYVEQGVTVPEEPQQREAISASITSCEQLIIGYKHVYKKDRTAKHHADVVIYDRMQASVMKIMELMRMVQWLRAMRYQKLSSQMWRDCNQIYFDARRIIKVDVPQRLEIRPKFISPVKENEAFEVVPSLSTIRHIYTSIQMLGVLDASTWPSYLIHVIDAYLRTLKEPLKLHGEDEAEIMDEYVVIHQYQTSAPKYAREEGSLGTVLLLNTGPLRERLRNDLKMLKKNEYLCENNKLFPDHPLAKVARTSRRNLLELMLRKLQQQVRREKRNHAYQAKYARIYGGFVEIYNLFCYLSKLQDTGIKKIRRFKDELAKYSSFVDDGEDGGGKLRWLVVNESPNGLQLRIKENRYTVGLRIGLPLVYGLDHDQVIAMKIGYIVRLQRVEDQYIEIGISRLSDRGMDVVISGDNPQAPGQMVPAILLHGTNNHWQLLFGVNHGMTAKGKINLVVDGRNIQSYNLGDMVMSQPDFTLFNLDIAAGQKLF